MCTMCMAHDETYVLATCAVVGLLTAAHAQPALHLPPLDRVSAASSGSDLPGARAAGRRQGGDGRRRASWRRCGGWPAIRRSSNRSSRFSIGWPRRACRRSYESFAEQRQGWEQRARHGAPRRSATGEVLLSRETHRVALASIRSARRPAARRSGWSTSARGTTRPSTTART